MSSGTKVVLYQVIVVALLPLFRVGAEDQARIWTSEDGKQLRASLVSADKSSAVLKLESGREARVALTRLSEQDRNYVLAKYERGQAFDYGTIPPETQIPREIEVTGGPRVFQTPHFEFETDQEVSKAFISEAARVYEGTYLALRELPHGIELEPPAGNTHFRGRFLGEREFDTLAAEKTVVIQGQRVVGLYLTQEKELLVPYSSLGAKLNGSRMTLRKSSDTSTLIHEIVHQVMHDWLPLMPTWFAEGIAEYLAAVPYQNGRFEFRNAERGLKFRLEEQHAMKGNTISGVRSPSYFFRGFETEKPEDVTATPGQLKGTNLASQAGTGLMVRDGWSGSVDEYRDSMLLLYFFMHLDEPENQGVAVGSYLKMIDLALGETNELQQEIAQFETRRLAYNEEVKRFNAELESFREAVSEYNERVTLYNRQLVDGVPETERIKVGAEPREPVPPAKLEVPESIERASRGGQTIDLLQLVQQKALPSLLQNRTPQQLSEEMKAAYSSIGIDIQFQ